MLIFSSLWFAGQTLVLKKRRKKKLMTPLQSLRMILLNSHVFLRPRKWAQLTRIYRM
jgi:hypothetical protein